MHGALVGPYADPCRVAVEGNTVDLGPIRASPELVQQLTGTCIKYADQGAFVRGRGTFGAVRIGHQAKERAGVGGDDGDVGGGFGASHWVFGWLCVVHDVVLEQGR